jgi:hypothetical protein
MKTRTGVLFSLLLLVAAVALITGSCDNSLNLSGYYIYAELDGIAYEWKLGATMIADDALGVVSAGTEPSTTLLATPDVITGEDILNDSNWIMITFEGTTIGTYSEADVSNAGYMIDGITWIITDITINVTTFESAGGVIKGTFSGTLLNMCNNTMTVQNGQFNVIHAVNPETGGG